MRRVFRTFYLHNIRKVIFEFWLHLIFVEWTAKHPINLPKMLIISVTYAEKLWTGGKFFIKAANAIKTKLFLGMFLKIQKLPELWENMKYEVALYVISRNAKHFLMKWEVALKLYVNLSCVSAGIKAFTTRQYQFLMSKPSIRILRPWKAWYSRTL